MHRQREARTAPDSPLDDKVLVGPDESLPEFRGEIRERLDPDPRRPVVLPVSAQFLGGVRADVQDGDGSEAQSVSERRDRDQHGMNLGRPDPAPLTNPMTSSTSASVSADPDGRATPWSNAAAATAPPMTGAPS